jgi:ribosomal protein L11 methyltransferase
VVPHEQADLAHARLAELFPPGHEYVERVNGVELAVWIDQGELDRLRAVFPEARAVPFPDDWHERWKRFHHGFAIGPLWVGPPWEPSDADRAAVVIDPGRAFGTGAHPTTRLCLELLLKLVPDGVADLGCGSGVLAIAAAKLGHSPVWALDVDPAAVEAAAGNAAVNEVEVRVRLADATRDPLPRTTVALANLALDPLRAIAPRLRCRLLVASGYRDCDVLGLRGFRSVERLEAEGWAAELYARE